MSQLTEEQMTIVRAWCAEGADLAQVQSRLDSELGVKMTYLDTRMLLAELEVEAGASEREKEREARAAKEAAAEKAKADAEKATAEVEEAMGTEAEAAGGTEEPAGVPSNVSVSVASVTPPGMIVAGEVVFSDGESAEWYLDQMGRLGMNPKNPDHKPTEADLQAFQLELQTVLKKQGF